MRDIVSTRILDHLQSMLFMSMTLGLNDCGVIVPGPPGFGTLVSNARFVRLGLWAGLSTRLSVI